MSTEKLEASEEPQAPLANTSETNSIKGDAENIVTVFDLANEIEKSLKDVQRQMKENDDEFSRSIQAVSYTHLDVYKRQVLFYVLDLLPS